MSSNYPYAFNLLSGGGGLDLPPPPGWQPGRVNLPPYNLPWWIHDDFYVPAPGGQQPSQPARGTSRDPFAQYAMTAQRLLAQSPQASQQAWDTWRMASMMRRPPPAPVAQAAQISQGGGYSAPTPYAPSGAGNVASPNRPLDPIYTAPGGASTGGAEYGPPPLRPDQAVPNDPEMISWAQKLLLSGWSNQQVSTYLMQQGFGQGFINNLLFFAWHTLPRPSI